MAEGQTESIDPATLAPEVNLREQKKMANRVLIKAAALSRGAASAQIGQEIIAGLIADAVSLASLVQALEERLKQTDGA